MRTKNFKVPSSYFEENFSDIIIANLFFNCLILHNISVNACLFLIFIKMFNLYDFLNFFCFKLLKFQNLFFVSFILILFFLLSYHAH